METVNGIMYYTYSHITLENLSFHTKIDLLENHVHSQETA